MKARRVTVAVAQAAPVLFETASALDKAAGLAREAARQGAELLVFPETYLTGYPRGLDFGARIGSRTDAGRRDWERCWASAVDVPGPETAALGELAAEHGLTLVVGVTERDAAYSRGTLYNTIVYIGPDGGLLGKHRKLVPTGTERLLWGQGDGSTLTVVDSPIGRIGGLICWENYMPLARMAMYGQGIELYAAPTADARDSWQATIRHIACEGRCFVLAANQFATKASYPADLLDRAGLRDDPDVLCRGGSAIVGPLGDYVAGPLYDREGLLVAELDLGEVVRGRFDFDVAGHYGRPDIFRLTVDRREQANVHAIAE
ncbi:carbon-nitrogen hydrolase family protein [Paenibacillus sp. MWE-103]|uniref:Carbon-nitrogen hydrolase family protein n=1 Tax=Paenibacillus artemisiicola TaxID=1172618 RepID=A0ABS3W3B6_9BACL|nr:carbon-nitrogen hydrolase family protein [Paenibacillus artemisiicola]MBO7742798.1 carbon-nitrogen hydrolase family protein [Paenibacillus artemisiicola]